MKKLLLICLGLFLQVFSLEQKSEIAQPLVEHTFKSRDYPQAVQAYKEYKENKPPYKVLANELRSIFPLIFQDVPLTLHQALADYVPHAYPDENLIISEFSKFTYNQLALRLFKWKALGYNFGLMPYYSDEQGYFYFEQPNPINSDAILKGVREDRSVKALAELDDLVKKLQNSRDPKKDEYIRQIKNEWKEVADSIGEEYKIHLMPQGDPTPTIVTLLMLLQKDPELQNLIAAFKVKISDKLAVNGVYYPRIVVYPAKGKDAAQKALNKLYAGLKDIKGLDFRPRYNAKVNDLIWVAQGDSNYKNDPRYQAYFEKPEFRYFRPDLNGKTLNYHLIHPETGKELV